MQKHLFLYSFLIWILLLAACIANKPSAQPQPIPPELIGVWKLTNLKQQQSDSPVEPDKATSVVLAFNADSTYVAQYDIGPSRHEGHFRLLSTNQIEITVERDSMNKPIPPYTRTFRVVGDVLILNDNTDHNTATSATLQQTYYRQKP